MPLPLSDFDAILGMDGLSRYKATMDCFARKVDFGTKEGRKACFVGDSGKAATKIVSAMTAMKYLRKGCEAFLAYVISYKEQLLFQRLTLDLDTISYRSKMKMCRRLHSGSGTATMSF